MGGVAAEPNGRRKRPHDEAADAANTRSAEGEELAPHVRGERQGELERISFAAAEEPAAGEPERRGSDVNDAHLRLALLTLGDPRQRTGGYRYHRIMAAAAPEHRANVRFRSLPAVPFPTPALAAGHVLRRAAQGSDAVLLDSIAAAYAAPWISRIRSPVIGVIHQAPGGMDRGRVRRWLQARLDVLAYRSAVGFVVASESLADELVARALPPAAVRVVPPGHEVPVAPGGKLELRRGRAASLLCVANWLPRKGILELLDAFARLPGDAATLWLVGATGVDRRYARRVRRRLASADLAGRVVVVGAVAPGEVGRLYASADAFVLPSFVDPYGTAWAEAMAFGLPVVGWRAANLRHLATDGREALMVEAGDVDGLANALRRVAEDPALRERLAAGSRARARTFVTWERSARMFFEAIRDLLASPASTEVEAKL
jgi:glycosyltransferase involved in cell wall biosynthesis